MYFVIYFELRRNIACSTSTAPGFSHILPITTFSNLYYEILARYSCHNLASCGELWIISISDILFCLNTERTLLPSLKTDPH